MYHGIKYKGLRYKLFFFPLETKKSQLEGLSEKTQGNEKGLGKEVQK